MLSVDAGLVAKMQQPMPLGLVSCQLGTVNKAICHGVWGKTNDRRILSLMADLQQVTPQTCKVMTMESSALECREYYTR